MSRLGRCSRSVYHTAREASSRAMHHGRGARTLISHETDFRGLSLSSCRSSMPRRALYNVSPVPLPSASQRVALLFCASSPRLVVPSFSSAFCRAEYPNPWRLSMSSGARNSATLSCLRWKEPPGFARRDARRANVMLLAIPMLTESTIVSTSVANLNACYLTFTVGRFPDL